MVRISNRYGVNFGRVARRPVDLIIAIVSLLSVSLLAVIASRPDIPSWEISFFRTINELPDFIFPIIWPFMQYGVFITIPVASLFAWYFKKRRLALMMLIGGICIYFGALILKNLVDRGRPPDILDGVIAREQFRYLSLGFTSGHAAVAATIATFAHRYLPYRWQLLSVLTLAVVAFGRIYIGGHLPLDVLGGIALGVGFASLINFLFGSPLAIPKETKKQDAAPLKQIVRVHRPRHPGDIVRVAAGSMVFAGATFLAFTGDVGKLEEYFFRFINNMPSILSSPLQFVMQAGALYFVPIAAMIALFYRHPRLAIKISVGGTLVWLLAKLAKALVDRDRPFYILSGVVERATNSGILGFPSGHAAVAALIATVASPYMSKSWSRVLWTVAWTVALSRMYVGAHLPLDIFAGLALGWIVGSLLNLLLGTPEKALPRHALLATLKLSGVKLKKLSKAHVDARGSSPLFAETVEGKKIFVKVVDNEHRNADILFKAWRYFTIRDVEDEAPFTTAKHLVEHEAYAYNQARAAGVRVPMVRLAAPINKKAAILVTDKIDGWTLDVYRKPLDRQLLRKIWQQINKLHNGRIAHRDLRAANVFIDKKGDPWIIDYSFADTASSEKQLSIDMVEAIVSLSMCAPTTEVVGAAINVMGKDSVGRCLPYIQKAVLTSVTRQKLKNKPGVMDDIRREIVARTGIRAQRPVKVKRFGYETIVWLGLGLLFIYFLLSQAGRVGDYIDVFDSFHPGLIFAALGASVFTYVSSAFVLVGASSQPLAYGRTLILHVATSFVNRITPKSMGGIAITERYLEQSGLERPKAVSAVSLAYSAGFAVHTVMTLLMLTIVSRQSLSVDLPDGWALIALIVGLLSLIGLTLVPRINKFLRIYLRHAMDNVRVVVSSPLKLAQLLGGSAGVTLAYSLALYLCLQAFGGSAGFGVVLLVYLAGNIVAAAAPTPGGLGAVEASLAGGLAAFGVPLTVAVTSVMAFRFITYWLPILPGALALRYLRRERLI